MCGLVGLILKEPGPLGQLLAQMIAAIQHRGPDSTGFALYGPRPDGALQVRLRIEKEQEVDRLMDHAIRVVEKLGSDLAGDPEWDAGPPAGVHDRHVTLYLREGIDVRELVRTLEADAGLEVQSVGTTLRIVKDVGTAGDVASRHRLDGFSGTHGLAHCRLATESVVNVEHSHPFWARPFADVAIVHNGQLTNYYKWRRRLEQVGYAFATDNDSELIAVYVADRMRSGASLEEALRDSVAELDGTFTYLISTADGIGMAKDRFAAKPSVVAEGDAMIGIASEEVALRQVFPEGLHTLQPAEREVMTWWRSTPKA